ncbi:Hachiman antiphage defense system protein HamA [Planococcus sp. NCCP-2050]|uniref:Hachiman antiphage defense system protein HamA n=1 Tax=Planococcus sp. NCCP-2050 TaxID=2944679 RepID=UPI00203B2B05|nr:Hachiman antiphage defense system protein HamA [Planococcus sp. NCCP-2050]GKW47020.1 hypothetical protein NCCP2050_27120 [Planococcus sp. NCCP-2050]
MKPHLSWLKKIETEYRTNDGKLIELYDFSHEEDEDVLREWARHFKQQYCLEDEIDLLREGTGLSRGEYLEKFKFPTLTGGAGPGIRSGDFGEILIADYLEYILGFWVPRTRYGNKTVRNESTKGSDTLALKVIGDSDSLEDTLAIYEVKAQLSQTKGRVNPRLQDAINDSSKDIILRKAESLNAAKQYFIKSKDIEAARKISRFQMPEDRPYTDISGAAAIFDNSKFDIEKIKLAKTTDHFNKENLNLIVIKGNELMDLVNTLYKRCIDEA